MDGEFGSEYLVELGGCCDSFWLKKLRKFFKKTVHPWESIQTSLFLEYRFIDKARRQYTDRYDILTVSSGANCILIKHQVKLPNTNISAKQSGIRASLFVEKDKEVIILFVGHHKHYGTLGFNSEKECIKHMVKKYYPAYAKKLGI